MASSVNTIFFYLLRERVCFRGGTFNYFWNCFFVILRELFIISTSNVSTSILTSKRRKLDWLWRWISNLYTNWKTCNFALNSNFGFVFEDNFPGYALQNWYNSSDVRACTCDIFWNHMQRFFFSFFFLYSLFNVDIY